MYIKSRMEDRYRQIFENANDVIYTTDLEHNVTALNKAGEQLTGYSSEEIVGRTIGLIIPPEYIVLLDQIRDRMIAGQPSSMYEIDLITREGSRLPVEASTRLIFDSERPVGIQSILRDVSERKRLEKQLWASQKMEAVGQLAGGIAHDFNNILTIILGYTKLASDSIDSAHPVFQDLNGIRKAVDRASTLTRQLLAFSRRQVLRPTVLNLHNVISDLDKFLKRLIGENVVLMTDLAPDAGRVKADQGQVEQVLMNLVINARDAMPDGGTIRITLRNTELTEEDALEYHYVVTGPYVMIEVADVGVGMDEETLSHIFEPFFTTKQAGKGTGLGLATVYGIVRQSGGYIWADSEPGQGACFRVFLPRTSEPLVKESTDVEERRAKNGMEVVLLVEDENELRALLRDTLLRRGYKVLEAMNGREALQVAEEFKGQIHLTVTDMVMPVMGGRDLADQLAALRPQTPVVFMSGYLNDSVIHHHGLESSAHFLQKPFEPAMLAEKIREVLDR
jgi:two-component system, cell cycle sensor histidine kinase and response regulator CckA